MKKIITALLVCFIVVQAVSKVQNYSVNLDRVITIADSDYSTFADNDNNDDDKTQTI